MCCSVPELGVRLLRLFFSVIVLQSIVSVAATTNRDITFEFRNGLIWVSVSTPRTERALTFLLDTGASVSVIDRELAKSIGLKGGRKVLVQGVGGNTDGLWPVRFEANLTDQQLPSKMLALDLSALSTSAGRDVDGIIGADFFSNRIVKIDYKRETLELFDRWEFQPPLTAGKLKLKKKGGVYLVPVSVNSSSLKWVRLDTGCNSSLHWVEDGATPEIVSSPLTIAGIRETQLKTAEIDATIAGGTTRMEAVLHARPLFIGENGLLGNGFLENFVLTLDVNKAVLYLESYSYRQLAAVGQ
jgi:hypothetical protein